MKAIVATILFICAAGATRNWVGLQETDLNELDNLLQDTKSVANPASFETSAAFSNLVKVSAKYSAEQNDHGEKEGSGVNPTEEPKNPIQTLVKAINSVIPALKDLREEREKQSHEYAKEFVDALNNEKNDNKVKSVFGKHIRLLHESCNKKLLEFAKAAHESDLFEKIPHEHVDLADVMGKIIERAEKGEGNVIEEFFKAAEKHDLKDHPGFKVILAIGGLLGDAACDLKLDGFLEAIGKVIKEQQGQQVDEDEDHIRERAKFIKDMRRILFFCKAVRKGINKSPKSPMQRALSLMFDEGCTTKEAFTVRWILGIISDVIQLGKKVAVLKHIDHAHKNAVIKLVTSLHEQGNLEKADLVLANYVLGSMRRGTLVGILVEHLKSKPPPRGKKPGRGSRDDETGATFNIEGESTNNHEGTL